MMSISVPYLSSPGSLKTAFERIRSAATPDRVTRDFVSTKLQIKGGTGAALIPFLKKIGFVASDGSPTDLYKQFRNPSLGGGAVAKAIKNAYTALGEVNEYFYELNDQDLLSLVVQVTGQEKDSATVKLICYTLKNLKAYADFEGDTEDAVVTDPVQPVSSKEAGEPDIPVARSSRGLSLSYTINLNLPASSDQAVFNAIFRALKEHLLQDVD